MYLILCNCMKNFINYLILIQSWQIITWKDHLALSLALNCSTFLLICAFQVSISDDFMPSISNISMTTNKGAFKTWAKLSKRAGFRSFLKNNYFQKLHGLRIAKSKKQHELQAQYSLVHHFNNLHSAFPSLT